MDVKAEIQEAQKDIDNMKSKIKALREKLNDAKSIS